MVLDRVFGDLYSAHFHSRRLRHQLSISAGDTLPVCLPALLAGDAGNRFGHDRLFPQEALDVMVMLL